MKASNLTVSEFHSVIATILGIEAQQIGVTSVVVGLKDSSDVLVMPVGTDLTGVDYPQTIRLLAEGISQATLHWDDDEPRR